MTPVAFLIKVFIDSRDLLASMVTWSGLSVSMFLPLARFSLAWLCTASVEAGYSHHPCQTKHRLPTFSLVQLHYLSNLQGPPLLWLKQSPPVSLFIAFPTHLSARFQTHSNADCKRDTAPTSSPKALHASARATLLYPRYSPCLSVAIPYWQFLLHCEYLQPAQTVSADLLLSPLLPSISPVPLLKSTSLSLHPLKTRHDRFLSSKTPVFPPRLLTLHWSFHTINENIEYYSQNPTKSWYRFPIQHWVNGMWLLLFHWLPQKCWECKNGWEKNAYI